MIIILYITITPLSAGVFFFDVVLYMRTTLFKSNRTALKFEQNNFYRAVDLENLNLKSDQPIFSEFIIDDQKLHMRTHSHVNFLQNMLLYGKFLSDDFPSEQYNTEKKTVQII